MSIWGDSKTNVFSGHSTTFSIPTIHKTTECSTVPGPPAVSSTARFLRKSGGSKRFSVHLLFPYYRTTAVVVPHTCQWSVYCLPGADDVSLPQYHATRRRPIRIILRMGRLYSHINSLCFIHSGLMRKSKLVTFFSRVLTGRFSNCRIACSLFICRFWRNYGMRSRKIDRVIFGGKASADCGVGCALCGGAAACESRWLQGM